jgi:hypothetical protein
MLTCKACLSAHLRHTTNNIVFPSRIALLQPHPARARAMKEAAIANIPGVRDEDPRQLFELAEKLGKVGREVEIEDVFLLNCFLGSFWSSLQGSHEDHITNSGY